MKKIVSLLVVLVLALTLVGCEKNKTLEENEQVYTQEEVDAMLDDYFTKEEVRTLLENILEDYYTQDELDEDFEDVLNRFEDLEDQINELNTQLAILKIEGATYTYDYSDYYLSEWTDEQLNQAVYVLIKDELSDEDIQELILEIIDDYDLIDQTEDQLIDLYFEALTKVLEEQIIEEE